MLSGEDARFFVSVWKLKINLVLLEESLEGSVFQNKRVLLAGVRDLKELFVGFFQLKHTNTYVRTSCINFGSRPPSGCINDKCEEFPSELDNLIADTARTGIVRYHTVHTHML